MAKESHELAAQAERIRALRSAERVTQPEVAHSVGVTLRAYQTWEAGIGDLDPRNLKALAVYFDTTADWIEYGVEHRPQLTTPQQDSEILERLDQIEDRLRAIEQSLATLITERAVVVSSRSLQQLRRQPPGADQRGRG